MRGRYCKPSAGEGAAEPEQAEADGVRDEERQQDEFKNGGCAPKPFDWVYPLV
jgi:hypothetical protein